jgi:hypothetical protein
MMNKIFYTPSFHSLGNIIIIVDTKAVKIVMVICYTDYFIRYRIKHKINKIILKIHIQLQKTDVMSMDNWIYSYVLCGNNVS